MSLENEIKPLPAEHQQSVSETFAAYCEAVFERRRNSEEDFDEGAYREAMELALARLRQLEEEGLA
jgi:hypothetical protein